MQRASTQEAISHMHFCSVYQANERAVTALQYKYQKPHVDMTAVSALLPSYSISTIIWGQLSI